jgi:hypothetical protein
MIKGRWTFAALVASSTLGAAAAADAQPVRTININSLPAGAAVRVDAMSATPLGTTPLRRVRVPGWRSAARARC